MTKNTYVMLKFLHVVLLNTVLFRKHRVRHLGTCPARPAVVASTIMTKYYTFNVQSVSHICYICTWWRGMTARWTARWTGRPVDRSTGKKRNRSGPVDGGLGPTPSSGLRERYVNAYIFQHATHWHQYGNLICSQLAVKVCSETVNTSHSLCIRTIYSFVLPIKV